VAGVQVSVLTRAEGSAGAGAPSIELFWPVAVDLVSPGRRHTASQRGGGPTVPQTSRRAAHGCATECEVQITSARRTVLLCEGIGTAVFAYLHA